MFSADVKKEREVDHVDDSSGFTFGDMESELQRASEHKARVREIASRMATEAGLGQRHFSAPLSRQNAAQHPERLTSPREGDAAVNRHGGAHVPAPPVPIKTPKYSGKADWEAFYAQFELLAHAGGWSVETKALQLAMCLVDDALACLLLLSPEERLDYTSLVGALRRRFGQCLEPGLIRSELSNRRRRPGEELRLLANDIESLSRRAYAHMPPYIQSELARDQFIRALIPADLRVQTQLAHPRTLQEALEFALERELVWTGASGAQESCTPTVRSVADSAPVVEKPAWVEELTELVRAVSLQGQRRRPQPGTRACWGCGQPGHLVRDCPTRTPQGNGSGSA